MPKLLSSDEIVKILLANGFVFISQRGSHQKYRTVSGVTVIAPAGRKQTPRGTLQSIIRQSGLDADLFKLGGSFFLRFLCFLQCFVSGQKERNAVEKRKVLEPVAGAFQLDLYGWSVAVQFLFIWKM